LRKSLGIVIISLLLILGCICSCSLSGKTADKLTLSEYQDISDSYKFLDTLVTISVSPEASDAPITDASFEYTITTNSTTTIVDNYVLETKLNEKWYTIGKINTSPGNTIIYDSIIDSIDISGFDYNFPSGTYRIVKPIYQSGQEKGIVYISDTFLIK